MTARDDILKLGDRVGQSVIGQEQMVERLLLGVISNGHILVEGLPGLAKTRAIKSLAKNLESELSRIQFTPDLLPADVTGSEIYISDGAKSAFQFQQGPIFANLILADEINRAPAKVQSALLEAMEERQVTVGGKSYQLPDLFMVMATQNPIEQEGTYPLPEAQLDRFLLHIRVDYPDEQSEAAIMRLNRSEEQEAHDKAPAKEKTTRLSAQSIFEARKEIGTITVSEPVEKYMVALVFATRYPERYNADLAKLLQVGVSPRGVIGLDRMSRSYAWLKGRDFVTPDDVKAIMHDVFRHRLLLSYEAHASNTTPDQIIDRITELVAVS
ncbi:AAA family ATPase [Ochrobactrum sp. P6BS-III]|uniref:AAA family ATPase n=1 Tax=unclassified Ochrobactrum TaxID=239106 RepID=UPI000992911F|nr:MoxR-like ATPase [Ochrobactrum sp. P6BSIII]OOL15103.1 AAA family ATPase [Ochrobactrum sp. P6BS-III]